MKSRGLIARSKIFRLSAWTFPMRLPSIASPKPRRQQTPVAEPTVLVWPAPIGAGFLFQFAGVSTTKPDWMPTILIRAAVALRAASRLSCEDSGSSSSNLFSRLVGAIALRLNCSGLIDPAERAILIAIVTGQSPRASREGDLMPREAMVNSTLDVR